MKARHIFFLAYVLLGLVLFWSVLPQLARAADEPDRRLKNARVFILERGVNEIRDFDGLGHRALIVQAWRENFNAHGYNMYTVLMGGSRPGRESDLVTFLSPGKKGHEEALYDSPFTGEQYIASVRFLKATWRGHPATLAVHARRDLSKTESYIDRAPVIFSIYRLAANAEGIPGDPAYYFERVGYFTTQALFCNSDLAVAKVLGLPLPADYQGPNQKDGCVAGTP